MTPRCFLLLSATILLCAGPSGAGDWPEFRGPTGQGTVRDATLPLEWGPDKNVVWKHAIPGLGWSSPVVVAGRVYLTTAVPAAGQGGGPSLRVLCLDARSGKENWNVEVLSPGPKAPRGHTKNSQASPTPIFADGKLYVHFGHMGTACLDADGKVLWRQTKVNYDPVHGNGGSPVLVDGTLVFSCDGADDPFVVGLDAANGKVRWKTARKCDAFKKFAFCTPLVIDVGNKRQVVLPGSHAVCAYDPADGTEIWRVRYEGYSNVPRPVFGHGLVFVCTGYDPPASLLAIRPDGKGDVTETHVAWKVKKAVPLTPSPLLDGDELYLISDDGTASCLDAKTGTVHWSRRLGGRYSASPVLAAGRLYCQSEDSKTVVLKASKTFEELGRSEIGERTLASYAVADGALFLRTETALYRIGEK
jgi:outer membrane protein assembly factor BamB